VWQFVGVCIRVCINVCVKVCGYLLFVFFQECANSIANRMNSIAKVMNLIAKVMNSIAKVMSSIAKATNSIAKTCNFHWQCLLSVSFADDVLDNLYQTARLQWVLDYALEWHIKPF